MIPKNSEFELNIKHTIFKKFSISFTSSPCSFAIFDT